MSDASSSSTVEHGLEDMMLTDSIEIEQSNRVGIGHEEVPQETGEEHGTTREFAKTSACPTGISTTNPTQVGGPPTHTTANTAMTLVRSTNFPTVIRPGQCHTHAIDNKLSAKNEETSAMAQSLEVEASICFEQTTGDVHSLSASEFIIDKVLGTNKKHSFAAIIKANASGKDQEDRKPPFRLPKNNSSESFPNMSVSSNNTPPSSPQDQESLGKKKARKTNKSQPKDGQSTGRWTDEEHQAFLRGLHTYGREWKKVASHIPTRTSAQVRSHAQKYFAKLQKEEDSWAGSLVSGEGATSGVAGPNAVSIRDDASGHGGGMESSTATISSAVQANVERIMAHPETVEAEVEDTLRRLRERYEALQRRLEQTSAQRADTPNRKRRSPHPMVPDDQSSATSLSVSLQNEELIALSVLRGGLPAGDASVGASELSEENMDTGSHQTESTSSKKAKHD